jgi:phosphoenolpyruvate synthase/pyruvate phosphate dikinase
MTEVFSLQSETCLDASVVGAKAAGLAAAFQRGLPVLPGFVVPIGVSSQLLGAAAEQGLTRGLHAARFRVMGSDLPELGDLRAQVSFLADDVVVRSSSPLESAPEYSGAFTSYLGVRAAEVATAVRGVWASALTEEVLSARRALVGESAALGMAVLVQPEIRPEWSGTAQVHDDRVTVVVVKGSPSPLMAGWVRGETAQVRTGREGPLELTGKAALALVGAQILGAVADVAVGVKHELGDDLIEWAVAQDRVVLLQAKRSGSSAAVTLADRGPEPSVPPAAAGAARLVYAFAGSLGEQLVLPIVLAGVTSASMVPTGTPATGNASVTQAEAGAAWSAAQALSWRSRDRSWGAQNAAAQGSAEILAQLRGGVLGDAVDRLRSRPSPPPEEVTALLTLLAKVGDRLVRTGVLLTRDDLWGLSGDDVAGLISGTQSAALVADHARVAQEARRRTLMRWEPVVHTAVLGTGQRVVGQSACSGVGAGLVVLVEGVPKEPSRIPRMVLVAPRPIPQLAPLLWGASALVTFGGSEAAHLVEVARSLGVPTVLGCAQEELLRLLSGASSPTLAAVDGGQGIVAVDTGNHDE